MRTLRELRSNSVVITDRSPSDATILVAPLFGALALLAATQSPGGALGWASALALSGVAAGMIWAAIPRARAHELGPSAQLALDPNEEGEDTLYRVDLVQNGTRARLLEHTDVGVVLADVQRIATETGVVVTPAWGLPADFFASARRGAPPMLRAGSVVGNRSPTQTGIARACFGAGVFVLLVFAWSVLHAHTVSALSLALPLLSIAFVLLVGAWSVSRRTHVVVSNAGVRVHKVAFGRSRAELELSSDELVAAFAVGHEGYELQHLVFQTTRGPRAVPVSGEAARRAAELVARAPIDPRASLPGPDGHRDTAPRRPYGVRSARSAPQ